MHKQRAVLGLLLSLFFLSLLSEQNLMAYADPGSGAMYVQVILAAILGDCFGFSVLSGDSGAEKANI